MYSDAAKPIRGRFRTSSRRDLLLVEEWISKSDRWEFHRLGGPVARGGFPLVLVSIRPAAPADRTNGPRADARQRGQARAVLLHRGLAANGRHPHRVLAVHEDDGAHSDCGDAGRFPRSASVRRDRARRAADSDRFLASPPVRLLVALPGVRSGFVDAGDDQGLSGTSVRSRSAPSRISAVMYVATGWRPANSERLIASRSSPRISASRTRRSARAGRSKLKSICS